MSRKLIFWIAGSFSVLGLMLWGISLLWESNAEGLSGHGWMAYILGGVMTLGLSIGLFLLTFLKNCCWQVHRRRERVRHRL